jgi:hypothetical protein
LPAITGDEWRVLALAHRLVSGVASALECRAQICLARLILQVSSFIFATQLQVFDTLALNNLLADFQESAFFNMDNHLTQIAPIATQHKKPR